MIADMEKDAAGVCWRGQALLRLNAGMKMSIPENFAGVTDGGMKVFGPDFKCGGDVWSSGHTGCNRWGGHCIVSFDTPAPSGEMVNVVKKNELWLLGLNADGSPSYKRIGSTSPSFTNAHASGDVKYWSQSRAAMSMDGAQIIFDSDRGSNGEHHAVHQLSSGLPAVKRPVTATSSRPPSAGPSSSDGNTRPKGDKADPSPQGPAGPTGLKGLRVAHIE